MAASMGSSISSSPSAMNTALNSFMLKQQSTGGEPFGWRIGIEKPTTGRYGEHLQKLEHERNLFEVKMQRHL
jgi:hypothetical protein